MATWEQRRRGIMRTAYELESNLYAAENRYIDELRTGMVGMQSEMHARLNQLTLQPRSDGNFDWEKSQVESLVAELDRQIAAWSPSATSTVQAGTATADDMGTQYPKDILDAGGSTMRAQPRLSGTQLATFHAYDAGLVRNLTERTRGEISGLVRRAALGGDSVFALTQKIGTVAGKGAFATAFHRGEAIIRTEMGRSFSSASMITMNQSALYHPGLQKKWLSIIDSRIREEHARAHDQVRPLNKAFDVGGEKLMHPHDTSGSAWNTINCRCKAIPWDPAWEKLPPPGVEPKLGPLAMTDTASFDSEFRRLQAAYAGDRGRVADHEWADEKFRRAIVGRGAPNAWMRMDDEIRAMGWPAPTNPAYWRSKRGFTEAQLKAIAIDEGWMKAFMLERYGIELVRDSMDIDVQFSTGQGTKLLRALEAYRAIDPSLVVENERLRWIGTNSFIDDNTLGQASAFGDVAFNAAAIRDTLGRVRDPAGKTAPRMSDDAALEVFFHELAHSISYKYGIQGMAFPYTAISQLDPVAWQQWSHIHTHSMTRPVSSMTLAGVNEAIATVEAQLAAQRQLGTPEAELQPLIGNLAYLKGERLKIQIQTEMASDPNYSGGYYPSDYARENINEDFAESLTLAMMQPAEFKANHQPRYDWFVRWMPKLVGA